MSSAECRVSNTSIEYRGSRVEGKRTATSTLSSFFALCALHLHSTLFPRPFPPLVTRHSFFHRSNRPGQNSDNLVQQFDSFLNNLVCQPVLHSFVAPTRLTSRT